MFLGSLLFYNIMVLVGKNEQYTPNCFYIDGHHVTHLNAVG